MIRFSLIVLTLFCGIAGAQVKFEDILKSPNADWLTYAGDYRATGLSPLTQITPANAASMVSKWTYRVPRATGLRGRPIVYQGVMYVTSPNTVIALDATSGREIWKYYDAQAAKKRNDANRGAAILGDKIYFVTSDVHLVALDRRNGGLIFKKFYGQADDGVFASAAPLVVNNLVLVGTAGGDTGMRGFIAAMNADTGEEVWRTYTIPARGEKGSETWGNYVEYGGGATWLSGVYDPETDTLFWPTGNPWPDFYGGDRQGDNLYSCSLLALDPKTGKMKWYFQFTPGDTHDWDAQSWPIPVTIDWEGKPRKVILHANRNGFLYVLDRITGKFLRATRIVDQLDWATDIDKNGRPVVVPGKDPTPNGNRVCPGVKGATNWMSQSYNPATGLLTMVVLEQCDVFTSSSKEPEPKKSFSGGGAGPKPKDMGQQFVRAFDPRTGKRVWEYPMTGPGEMWAGTVGTVTGVIFFGDDDGHVVAVDGKSGKHLWHYNVGEYLYASPITYAVDGKQYVAIASASGINVFGLFEPARSVPVPKTTKVQ